MAKLYVISFEGMNFDILNQLIDKGVLENFKKIKQDGYLGKMQCSRIPYEASGLVSAFSGMQDCEHGVLSYWKANNYQYIPEFYTSKDIKDNMIWNKKELEEYKFAIINVFGTHPVYQVNKYLISYSMDRTLRYSYPDNLIRELASRNMPYLQDMAAFPKGQGKNNFLNEIYRVEGIRHEVCKDLLRDDIDVLIVNYTCIDRVCHFYMNEINNDKISFDDNAIYKMYQYSDSILGDFLPDIYKNHANLLLFSSVGFNPLTKFVEINPYLKENGFLRWSDNPRVPDWKKTVAFEAVQGTQGVNINKEYVYQHGFIKSNELDSVLKEVMTVLKKMRNPNNNNPMFRDVVLGKDFYNGSSYSPDIITLPYDNQYLPYGDSYWADKVLRHTQTGWHSQDTAWGYLGSDSKSMTTDKDICHITQIASRITQILKS